MYFILCERVLHCRMRKVSRQRMCMCFFILDACVETSSASCAANREIYSLLALLFLLLPKKARYATTFLGALR